MKKIFSLLALVLTCVGVNAQWWQGLEPDEYAYNDNTVVHAQLTTNLASTDLNIAAFIDGACRASAYPERDESGMPKMSESGKPVYIFNVRGNLNTTPSDEGKEIKFMLFDPNTGFEYELNQKLTFDGGTHGGNISNPTINFELTAPVGGWSLNLVEVEVGKRYNLANYLTVEPAGAQLPSNLWWKVFIDPDGAQDISPYVLHEDSVVTGVSPYDGLTLQLLSPGDPTGSMAAGLLAECIFNVVQYATGIELIEPTTITVKKDDFGAMSMAMQRGTTYKLNPENAVDTVEWEVEDATILQWSERGYYIPVKGGTTRIRPYFTDRNNNKVYPANDAWITVNVIVPVESIDIDLSLFNGEFLANMGDTHLYERLKRLVKITPQDADQTYTVEVETPGAVTLIGNTTLHAVQQGTSIVKVIAKGGDDVTGAPLSASVDIKVLNPLISAQIQQPTIYIPLIDGVAQNIDGYVRDNVIFDPSDGSNMGFCSFTQDGTNSITAEGAGIDMAGIMGTFTAVAAGTTTFTIELKWPDYDNWGVNGDELQYLTTPYTFKIVVTEQSTLMGFNVSVPPVAAGQTGTLTLIPQPVGATFEPESIVVKIYNGLEGVWANLITSTKKSAAADKIVYEFTSAIPGLIRVAATDVAGARYTINDGAYLEFEVGNPLHLSTGWQWRSNPYGAIKAADFEKVFTTAALDEIRTSNQLLYNDPSWGFYGTLTNSRGILQDQCYKIKMKAERDTVLFADQNLVNGTFSKTDVSYSVVLKPGWNWIGSPYLFDHSLSAAIESNEGLLSGTVIIGKNSHVELNELGVWEPSGMILKAGEGYVIKNLSNADVTLNFRSERSMTPQNEGAQSGVKAFGLRDNVWEYDHSRFMNNMTMVATLEGIDHPEQYSIGAFVGEECRGEGFVSNGKAFITVHCDAGEYVTFKLYNPSTNEYSNIHEGLQAQTRVGSLKAPFRLHTGNGADGIQNLNGNSSNTESYDLSGRRINSQQRGVSIRRQADGTMHKVIVK